MKNISRDIVIQKAINSEFWPKLFSVPREEIADVTDCRDNDTGSFPNNDDQGSSSAGNIHHPELQSDRWKMRMINYKRARTLEIFQILHFSMKKISRDNTSQKAINCEFWLLLFSVRPEEIAGVTDCRDNDTWSFSNNDDQGSSSAGNIHHPEIQNDLWKMRMINYKRARTSEIFELYNFYEKH